MMPLPSYSQITELLKKGLTIEAQEQIMKLREAARAKIIAASISFPTRCHSVACGAANRRQSATRLTAQSFAAVSWFRGTGPKRGLAVLQCFNANCLYAARIRLQNAVSL